MNQNSQEKKMRQLFRDLRKLDEKQAPTFASVLEIAVAKQSEVKSAWQDWRVAVAIVSIIVVIGLFFFFIQPVSTEMTKDVTIEPQDKVSPNLPDLPNDVISAPSPSARDAGVPKRSKPGNSQSRYAKQERLWFTPHKQLPTQQLKPAMLISNWQSPTDALLKTPSAEFLKSIPKVGEPLFEMNKLFPDEMN